MIDTIILILSACALALTLLRVMLRIEREERAHHRVILGHLKADQDHEVIRSTLHASKRRNLTTH